ncbi:uncharacterized protein LOC131842012 [Achroia grisella]|uniref:uncharacterized protein LOC131842012 n=1 Tax=Achroia grisella TaxID=688607 RepID=UPI0027D23D10|nr:uncharacterized protein LOC131842012 [Achroia grisella]
MVPIRHQRKKPYTFIIKIMEKVLDIRATILENAPLHRNQHAYRKGHSTETALLDLTDKVEKAIEEKQIALCSFLDIEGAFDNTPIETISQGLIRKKVDETTTQWIKAMLSNRTIKTTLHNSTLEIRPTKECPQGGVLSPLLWLLTVDQLLDVMTKNQGGTRLRRQFSSHGQRVLCNNHIRPHPKSTKHHS